MENNRRGASRRKMRRRRERNRRLFIAVLCAVLLIICVGAYIRISDTDTEDYIADTEEFPETLAEANIETEKSSVLAVSEESSETFETIVEVEQVPDYSAMAWQMLEDMTMRERIGQMFIVTQEQLTGVANVTQSGETTRKAIEQYPVGGIVYFAPNLISRDQCTSMISNIQEYSEIGLFIAVDEEGGRVARLGNNPSMGVTAFPAMKEVGDTGEHQKAYEVGYSIGTDISELGFNLDFAPVADVWSNPNNTVIGSRSFSNDAENAAEMVASCVEGFIDSGVLCTLKHFPGHGDTDADSHYGEAETQKDLNGLWECELIPFQKGIEAGAPFVMIGHITAPNAVEENVPATLSGEIITGILREQMGFEGIVITDSMSMQAITDQYSSAEAAVRAIQAGVDIILMPSDLQGALNGVMSAVENGELSEERINESVQKILELKLRSGIEEAADIS